MFKTFLTLFVIAGLALTGMAIAGSLDGVTHSESAPTYTSSIATTGAVSTIAAANPNALTRRILNRGTDPVTIDFTNSITGSNGWAVIAGSGSLTFDAPGTVPHGAIYGRLPYQTSTNSITTNTILVIELNR
jgi:hypothetical protein